jgi:hypothetical protein
MILCLDSLLECLGSDRERCLLPEGMRLVLHEAGHAVVEGTGRELSEDF